MLSRSDIIEMADARIDILSLPVEVQKQLQEVSKGRFNEIQKENHEYMILGVDLFLNSVGQIVELWNDGKMNVRKISNIDYDYDLSRFIFFFETKNANPFNSYMSFGVGAFGGLGKFREYYGIQSDFRGKTGIKFLK